MDILKKIEQHRAAEDDDAGHDGHAGAGDDLAAVGATSGGGLAEAPDQAEHLDDDDQKEQIELGGIEIPAGQPHREHPGAA